MPLVMANETGRAQRRTAVPSGVARNVAFGGAFSLRGLAVQVHLDRGRYPQRVIGPCDCSRGVPALPQSRVAWECSSKRVVNST